MHFFFVFFLRISLLLSVSSSAVYAELEEILPVFSIAETAYLESKKQLTVCVDPDWMPFEKIEKGKHVGMSADFMRLFEKKLSIPIVLVPTKTWLESLDIGKKRQCDFFSLIAKTPRREQFLNFSEAYLSVPLVIVSRFEHIYINEIEELLDKKIGVLKGYAYVELLRLQYPTIRLVDVDNLNEGLNQVHEGKLFAMVGSLPSIASKLRYKYMGELKISGTLNHVFDLALGARNDEPLLVGIFNKVIMQITHKERMDITRRWFTTRYQLETDYSALIKVLSILTLLFLTFLYYHFQLRKYSRTLEKLSTTDVLTQVSNRIKLDQQLSISLAFAERYQRHFSIIFIDVDNFKVVNNQHGHLVGDEILKDLATLIKENTRELDTVGRWGGEEFMVICAEESGESAVLISEKLRTLIIKYPFKYGLNLSCSFGVSSYQPLDTAETMVNRAGSALYLSKEKGRN